MVIAERDQYHYPEGVVGDDNGVDDGEGDTCGQCLMTIVARGAAIITELHRLVELIPEAFLQDCNTFLSQSNSNVNGSSNSNSNGKQWTLSDIVCDFSYFDRADEFEARIEREPTLKRLDEEFCDAHLDLLTRFYLTFEAVQRQASELNKFVLDLVEETGVYIGATLEQLLAGVESRQLLCEAHYQLGHMLLLVDQSFAGPLRERLIVAYYRYSAYRSSPGTHLDDTCKLLRATGFTNGSSSGGQGSNSHVRPAGYPESYFARAGVNAAVVNTLIAKLQTVDIYNQTLSVFPHPDHRSSALAHQAALLHVLLYFCPAILKSQRSRMREITDKFHPDQWVLSLGMGQLVNLFEAWEPYKAARESLAQVYDSECARSLAASFSVRFNRASKQLDEYLVEGWLSEDTFIEHQARLMNCLREANITLRWLLLHSRMRPAWQAASGSARSQIKIMHAVVAASQPGGRKLCEFLQNLCTLEKRVGALHEQVGGTRCVQMELQRGRACEMLQELVGILDGSQPMRWVQAGANSGLASILGEIKEALESLDWQQQQQQLTGNQQPMGNSKPSERDCIIRLINRMEAGRNSYSDGKSLQVVQLFADTREALLKLLRYLDLPRNFKIILQSVSDFSYAWQLMDELFTRDLQQAIKDQPLNLLRLEAVILKLSSAFEGQLVRIQQVGAQTDLISVSQYYSSKLVDYIRQVLQIIPATILELISQIISLQLGFGNTSGVTSAPPLPAKIPLEALREFARPEERARLLELTCRVSQYARGMRAMPATAIGLVRIDARRMLEEGLRRELHASMRRAIEQTLDFGAPKEATKLGQRQKSAIPMASQRLLAKLEELALTLGGYRRALEYIQDFLGVYGLRMWQEELTNIVRAQEELAISTALQEASNQQQQQEWEHAPLSQVSAPARSLAHSLSTLVAWSSAGAGVAHTAQGAAHKVKQQQVVAPRSFMSELLDELLKITSGRSTIYDEQTGAWYTVGARGASAAHEPVLDGARVCRLLAASLGVAGLNALDRLCAARLMLELEAIALQAPASHWRVFELLAQAQDNKLLHADELTPSRGPDAHRQQVLGLFFTLLGAATSTTSGATAATASAQQERLIDRLLRVGQLQTLRLSLACALSVSCRREARHLYGCLEAANGALLATLAQGRSDSRAQSQQKPPRNHGRTHATSAGSGSSSAANSPDGSLSEDGNADHDEDQYRRATASPLLAEESQLVFELAQHLEWAGLAEPRAKIYTMALHQRRLQQEFQQQQQQQAQQVATLAGKHFATSGDSAAAAAAIHCILKESVKLREQQQEQQVKQRAGAASQAAQQQAAATRQGVRALDLKGASSALNGGGGMLDGQPLYLGLQTLLHHMGQAQVVLAPGELA